jgi:hypothetical protein
MGALRLQRERHFRSRIAHTSGCPSDGMARFRLPAGPVWMASIQEGGVSGHGKDIGSGLEWAKAKQISDGGPDASGGACQMTLIGFRLLFFPAKLLKLLDQVREITDPQFFGADPLLTARRVHKGDRR